MLRVTETKVSVTHPYRFQEIGIFSLTVIVALCHDYRKAGIFQCSAERVTVIVILQTNKKNDLNNSSWIICKEFKTIRISPYSFSLTEIGKQCVR